MLNLPFPFSRPVPVEKIPGLWTAVPIPLDGFPKSRYATVKILIGRAVSTKILARGQQAFHEKGGLHEVATVVKHAKDRHRLAGASLHVMRPRSVIALGML